MFLSRRTPELPTPDQALRGRPEPAFPVPARHTVLGNPLLGPYPQGLEVADFGLGCFWGAERTFWQRDGVWTTLVGYQGGITPNPTYEEVCSGRTGHTEAVRVVFDPKVISYNELLKLFWESHNPTQGFRQGNDVGTQYRSAIYTHSPSQAAEAEASRASYQQVLTGATTARSARRSSRPRAATSTRRRRPTSSTWTRTRRATAASAARASRARSGWRRRRADRPRCSCLPVGAASRRRIDDGDLQPWEAATQRARRARQLPRAKAHPHRDQQLAHQVIGTGPRRRPRPPRCPHRDLRLPQERAADHGGHQSGRRTGEQFHAEFPLQATDLLGHRGLRDVQRLRRRRHRALRGNGQGVLVLTKAHRLASPPRGDHGPPPLSSSSS